jgi:hypothetical protein
MWNLAQKCTIFNSPPIPTPFLIEKAAMQEKLRKKAELQAQARRPMGYAESMEAERKKQKNLEKTKEERRAALCEELGRGC